MNPGPTLTYRMSRCILFCNHDKNDSSHALTKIISNVIAQWWVDQYLTKMSFHERVCLDCGQGHEMWKLVPEGAADLITNTEKLKIHRFRSQCRMRVSCHTFPPPALSWAINRLARVLGYKILRTAASQWWKPSGKYTQTRHNTLSTTTPILSSLYQGSQAQAEFPFVFSYAQRYEGVDMNALSPKLQTSPMYSLLRWFSATSIASSISLSA